MGHRISLDVEHEPAVQKYVTAILRRGHFQAVEVEDGALGGQIMDLTRVLSDLRSELERIDQAILALERLDRSTSGTPPGFGAWGGQVPKGRHRMKKSHGIENAIRRRSTRRWKSGA
jgi:hypothetical protein